MESSDSRRRIYTVSRLNQEVQRHLEGGFGTLWLEGELSNVARPASGHLYFSMKDSGAQIRCAMFSARNRNVDFRPESGDAVLVRGKLGLYAVRGDFQLIVEHMERAGAGRLQAAFEKLRAELDGRGWFAQASKRPLPPAPAAVGVVTSPSGAAVRDVLQVLARRAPGTRVVIYPTLTQGAGAPAAIVRALERAGRRAEVDALLLVRGGGSIEDLQAYNELAVATAVHECPLPVVSGVGHEIDVTIADLVADLRAPTPSAAAELVVPDGALRIERVRRAQATLVAVGQRLTARATERARNLERRLQARHPERRLRERMQRVDELDGRLARARDAMTGRRTARLDTLVGRLRARHPKERIDAYTGRLDTLALRLHVAGQSRIEQPRVRLQLLMRALDTVSPLAVLDRGFAVVRRKDRVIRAATELAQGDRIDVRVARGRLEATVERVMPDTSELQADRKAP